MTIDILEQRSLEDTARQLNAPAGTVSAWITRGRQQLKKRLARRGVVVSAGALAALLSQQACEAALSTTLAASLSSSACTAVGAGGLAGGIVSSQVASLMKGGLKMMLMAKVKAAAVGTLAVAAAGTVATTAVETQITAGKTASGGEVVLRVTDVPISQKDTNGEIYVAIPKQHLDKDPRQMWSMGAGMAYSFSRIMRLTRDEQDKLQALMEDAWTEADIVRAFTATKTPVSSTAAELLWDLYRGSQVAAKDGARIDVKRTKQATGSAHYQVTRFTSGGPEVVRIANRIEDLPAFLAALWPATEPAAE